MGTLFDQPPREETLIGYMTRIRIKAREFGFPDEMTPADWHALCDLTRTALAIQTADAMDEQLAGFGDILRGLVSAVENLSDQDA